MISDDEYRGNNMNLRMEQVMEFLKSQNRKDFLEAVNARDFEKIKQVASLSEKEACALMKLEFNITYPDPDFDSRKNFNGFDNLRFLRDSVLGAINEGVGVKGGLYIDEIDDYYAESLENIAAIKYFQGDETLEMDKYTEDCLKLLDKFYQTQPVELSNKDLSDKSLNLGIKEPSNDRLMAQALDGLKYDDEMGR